MHASLTHTAPQLHTGRLLLQPLSYALLEAYLRNDGSLERALGVNAHPRPISEALREALRETLLPATAAASGDAYLFCTLWTVVDKEPGVMVGDLCFKGGPDAAGTVEIGYGTYPGFEGKGYMSEAVGALVAWALAQPDVRNVAAETEKSNIASHRILGKNGFVQTGEDGDMLWWHRGRR